MQTFLPYPDLFDTSKALDWRRLGKQRVETKQILMTLMGDSDGWKNHPAVRMWKGFEYRLAVYGLYMSAEWRYRGYEDNLFRWFEGTRFDLLDAGCTKEYPGWFGDPEFHMSHQKKLIWKLPDHYASIFGLEDEPFGEPEYVWPI